MSYEKTFTDFVEDYKREYGEKKVRDVLSKLEKSKGVVKSLNELERLGTYPRAIDAISTVMNMPYFIFANKMTDALGAAFFLEIWNQKLNANNEILDDYELEQLLRKIFAECGKMM